VLTDDFANETLRQAVGANVVGSRRTVEQIPPGLSALDAARTNGRPG